MPIPVCALCYTFTDLLSRRLLTVNVLPRNKLLWFKLHAIIALDGYISDFILTSADTDDRVAIWDLTATAPFTTVIGDKGIGESLALHLKSENHINLLTIKRTNSKVKVSKQSEE
ncbi:transposase [Clostridium sp. Marseille-QA1073]